MQLQRAKKKIEKEGARITLIGQATPRHAAHYRRRFAPDLTILADEDRSTYKLVGAVRGGASELADVVLPDQDGNEVRLGDLWQDQPALLVWLRHYG